VTTSAVEPISNAEAAINRIMESLVISYALDATAATFTLVADYPDRALGAQRSFIALRFSGVHDFRRDPGNLAELQALTDSYSVADSPRPIVIQHLSVVVGRHDRSVELSFGPNFGEIAFFYSSVAGFVRHSRAEAHDGNWIYQDVRSGEAFDFARPFAGVLDPT
jgi:hypothetical protein